MSPNKTVVLYIQPNSPMCKAAKNYLSHRGIEFTVKDVSIDEQAQLELLQTYESQTTPTIVIDGKAIIGFHPGALYDALEG
ncbi:MAG TPA: glutaredoxin family protein [Candidatus Angelobacter sp.]|nr:glutaredoxin family protein [Candidatus Angelobacter sp.]